MSGQIIAATLFVFCWAFTLGLAALGYASLNPPATRAWRFGCVFVIIALVAAFVAHIFAIVAFYEFLTE